MDCGTGELIKLYPDLANSLKQELNPRFTPVPDELRADAEAELGDQDRVMVDMEQDTPLTRWAKSQNKRVDHGRKARQQMAKASRRRNR